MTDPDAVITLKDVYREVVQLNGRLAAIDTLNATAAEVRQDHEARLRLLERWRYALPASLGIGFGSTALAAVALFIHH